MLSANWLSAISQIFKDLQSVPRVLLSLGLILFVYGVLGGPFSLDNLKISWGLAAISESFGWRYLSSGKSYLIMGAGTPDAHTRMLWNWSRIFWGLVFTGSALALIFSVFKSSRFI